MQYFETIPQSCLSICSETVKVFKYVITFKSFSNYSKSQVNLNEYYKISDETRVDLLQPKCSIMIGSTSLDHSFITHTHTIMPENPIIPLPSLSMQTHAFKDLSPLCSCVNFN